MVDVFSERFKVVIFYLNIV